MREQSFLLETDRYRHRQTDKQTHRHTWETEAQIQTPTTDRQEDERHRESKAEVSDP